VTTGDKRGLEYLRQALAVLDPATHPFETANALSIEGRFHHLAGRHSKAIELLKRAADLIAPAAETDKITTFEIAAISQVYPYLAGAYQHYALFEESNKWARYSMEFGEGHGILFSESVGLEFLGENAMSTGEFAAGIEYADREQEIAEKLHSRERRAWTHFVAANNSLFLGDLERAEREFTEGIALAEAIGETRVGTLLKGNFAVLLAEKAVNQKSDEARRQILGDALQTALDNLEDAKGLGLMYTSQEAHRCLAYVRFRRGELEDAENECAAGMELLAPTESRVGRLWLMPLYIEVLLARRSKALEEGRTEEAAAKLESAVRLSEELKELVGVCQAPRYTRESERLAAIVDAEKRSAADASKPA
jgi:tetratricopeptide (TPR) repeat protein